MKIPHEMILASAGSGKTYTLGLRYIRLLAAQQNPAQIAALTFTRKAAGEFLGHILERLAAAAGDSIKAKRLGDELKMPNFDSAQALHLLRNVTDSLHRLKLGTLDSFLHRIIQCLAPDLGLPGPPQLMDGFSLQQARESVWHKVFRQASSNEKNSLMHLCLENNWNEEGKHIQQSLTDFIDKNHELFIANPLESIWNDPYAATLRKSPWISDPKHIRLIIDNARMAMAAENWSDVLQEKWKNFFTALQNWSWGQPVPEASDYFLEKFLPEMNALHKKLARLNLFRKEYILKPECCEAVWELLSIFIGSEFYRSRKHTQMVWQLIDRFERGYHRQVRNTGKLSFADLPKMLLGEFGDIPRDLLYYRLDGQVDHWLLDEFQDTSRIQWNALADWIDEVLQDPEGRRTFFYVGDVKQSIYGWRGGDPYLFTEIYQRYQPVIEDKSLDKSWRSGKDILDTVNKIFSNQLFLEKSFPADAVKRWQSLWRDHQPSPATANKPGFSAVYESSGKGLETKLPAMANWLKKAQPTERGLSCAILTQNNAEVDTVIDFLRSEKLPVSREGEMAISLDNELGLFALAWFQLAAHPDDRWAKPYLRMHAIYRSFAGGNDNSWLEITESLRVLCLQKSFQHAISWLLQQVEGIHALDEFHKMRQLQLLSMAGQFDRMGSKDLHAFVNYMREFRIRESSESASIQVMTIHKSKGLGFDIVMLPSLGGNRLDTVRQGKFIYSENLPSIAEWIFKSPVQKFAVADPVLNHALLQRSNDACFEKFCQLYVATTRAKNALLMYLDKAPKNGNSANFEKWIRESLPQEISDEEAEDGILTESYRCGSPDWYLQYPIIASNRDTTSRAKVKDCETFQQRPHLLRKLPSEPADHLLQASQLINDTETALEKGTRIHAQLANIEWLDAGECSEYPAIDRLFNKPEEPCVLWREMPFDQRDGETWISGIFDRVHLILDPSNKPVRAEIYDFKTDQIKPGDELPRASHAGQLAMYSNALAKITGLKKQNVRTYAVYLSKPEIVETSLSEEII